MYLKNLDTYNVVPQVVITVVLISHAMSQSIIASPTEQSLAECLSQVEMFKFVRSLSQSEFESFVELSAEQRVQLVKDLRALGLLDLEATQPDDSIPADETGDESEPSPTAKGDQPCQSARSLNNLF